MERRGLRALLEECRVLERIATVSYRRRWVVLGLWVVALVGALGLGNAFGGATSMNFKLPDSDSQKAIDLLRRSGAGVDKASGKVVFTADDVTAPAVRERMTALFEAIADVPHVGSVASPFAATPQAFLQVSSDHTVAFAEIHFSQQIVERSSVEKIVELGRSADLEGLRVEFAGQPFQIRTPPGGTEAIGLLAAVVILLVAFGSVLAMGLPIITALFGIGIGLAVGQLLANVVSMPEFASQLAAMIGIGVGIDYALFIVTRHRQLLHSGVDVETSVVKSIRTSGKAVIFAGTTVVISLLGMFVMRVSFINGLALAAAAAVLVTMLASITLLPAILGFVGLNIDRFALPWAKRATSGERNIWFRWSRLVQGHPWVMAIIGLVILGGLAIPMLSLRLGNADDGNLPTTSTLRRAYDLLSDGFGPGFNGQILVAAETTDSAAAERLGRLQTAIAADPGVKFASPVQQLGHDVAVIAVYPTTSPQDEATVALIHRLRDETIPAATRGSDVQAHVGGVTALFDDVAALLGERLPEFIAAVLSLSFLLLLVVFRSLLVPFKAVIMNLLSIGASYGVLVLIFQEGVGADLLGTGRAGPIESFVPMMMFAIIFGLSMDYEVFLLSRIKEEYDRTGDNSTAVADGLSHTARVITAAAAIMVCVFGSFVFVEGRIIKEFGFGLALAVFIDATVVRMILVPATMELLGDANWWLPRWLARVLPDVHIEGEPDAPVLGDPDEDAVMVAEPARTGST